MTNLYVITGGPSSGKTTTIEAGLPHDNRARSALHRHPARYGKVSCLNSCQPARVPEGILQAHIEQKRSLDRPRPTAGRARGLHPGASVGTTIRDWPLFAGSGDTHTAPVPPRLATALLHAVTRRKEPFLSDLDRAHAPASLLPVALRIPRAGFDFWGTSKIVHRAVTVAGYQGHRNFHVCQPTRRRTRRIDLFHKRVRQ